MDIPVPPPPHSEVLDGDQMGEIPNLINKLTDTNIKPTVATLGQYSGDMMEGNPTLENQ